jgi:hypothetical protein
VPRRRGSPIVSWGSSFGEYPRRPSSSSRKLVRSDLQARGDQNDLKVSSFVASANGWSRDRVRGTIVVLPGQAGTMMRGQPGERLVADVDGAGGGDESGDGIDKRGLAGAVGAAESRDLAGLGLDGHIAVGRSPRIERSRSGRTGLPVLAI